MVERHAIVMELFCRLPESPSLLEWRDSEPFEEAAAWAAAATLAKVYVGVLFDKAGIHAVLPAAACCRARELFGVLTPSIRGNDA